MEVCHTSNPALILIPDISGFTKYIATSEISHSQEKIALLLESILENNMNVETTTKKRVGNILLNLFK